MIGANGQQINKFGQLARGVISRALIRSVYLDVYFDRLVEVRLNGRRNRAAGVHFGDGDPNHRA